MKKKILKELGEQSKILPPLFEAVNVYEKISGKELKEKMPEKLKDTINERYDYTEKKIEKKLVNHLKNIKKAYNKGGMNKVKEYNNWVLKEYKNQKK